MELDSAVLYSNDIQAAVNFYKEIIGLTLEYQENNHYASFIFSNGGRLSIKKQKRKEKFQVIKQFT